MLPRLGLFLLRMDTSQETPLVVMGIYFQPPNVIPSPANNALIEGFTISHFYPLCIHLQAVRCFDLWYMWPTCVKQSNTSGISLFFIVDVGSSAMIKEMGLRWFKHSIPISWRCAGWLILFKSAEGPTCFFECVQTNDSGASSNTVYFMWLFQSFFVIAPVREMFQCSLLLFQCLQTTT